MMRKTSWMFLLFLLLFIACDNSNLTKEQEEINQLSQELENVKAQLKDVTSQVDKTNQELNQINVKLSADVRVEPKPIDNAENANGLKPQVIDGQQEKPNDPKPNDPKPKDEVQGKPTPKPLDLTDMVLIPTTFQEILEPVVFNEFGDIAKPERKVKKVHVPSFYIDKYEVTVGQFREFLRKSGYKPKFHIDWNVVFKVSPTDDHPMPIHLFVDAIAYANWVGKRLPTADEWMHAAYGRETTNCKDLYESWPWGKGEKAILVARDHANYNFTGGKDKWEKTTAPVGSFKPNGYGIYDIVGNLAEFTLPGDHSPWKERRGGSYKDPIDLLHVRIDRPGPPGGGVAIRCAADVK